MNGWGETLTPRPPSPGVIQAAARLADTVRRWNRERTTASEQRMVDALTEYDRQTAKPW